MFNNVLRCLVSSATVGFAASATADCLRDRDNAARIGDNATRIGNNSADNGDDTAGIVNMAAKVIPC